MSFLVVLGKLFEIQIIKGEYFRKLSVENRIREVILPAPRGRILARGDEVLAGNIEVNKEIIFNENQGFTLVDATDSSDLENVITDYKRYYPLNDKFSHALGYLAKVSSEEVGKINPDCPSKGPLGGDSMVGKIGLEKEYECALAGIPGKEIIEVDARGRKVRELGRIKPIPGNDLHTTIDYGLQNLVSEEMGNQKGAIIVTGEKGQILAFYSYPGFDPNIFIDKGNSGAIAALLENPDLPFFDRVIGGTFHPGSVFKPLVAIAALEDGVIDKNFTYNDQGQIIVNNYSYKNWYFTENGRVEGNINLTRAIARSTDTFFYTIGQMLGPENIAKWADTFGLNKPTGIDLPGEKSGLIPTPEWKKSVKNESWFLGNTYHMSIGQGDVAVTPIEINTYISAISDGGMLCRPYFNMDKTPLCSKVKVSASNLDLVKEGMKEACTSGGTAYTFFDFEEKHGGVNVACKTGTAEVSLDGTPHAWFTFFAPIDNTQITATVLVEKGGQGSSVAGPIARKIADYYFVSFASSIGSTGVSN